LLVTPFVSPLPGFVWPKGCLPVKTYDNADTQKLEILKDNKGKSGIYLWENKINGNVYIGSSTSLTIRLIKYFNSSHLLKYPNMSICKALLKHGYSNFSFHIVEYCESDKCLQREQYYIDLLNPKYNILRTAGSSLGYKH
jgi:group I intron endonuclease